MATSGFTSLPIAVANDRTVALPTTGTTND
ncbi:hypothetical protein A2U01_0088764 [Trifolium medium]|uniref:Uncharacterized protein n=1 Tax=Trifolium medium TaxID=97028 RepID=A0A392U6X7_9FABA|nr:hypothetical protein [Trifolium medium]